MDTNRWRAATIALAFLLLAVCFGWVMRERSVADERRREREQWQAQMETIVMRADETSKLIERLDLAYDELRRKVHHATTQPGGE